MNYYDEDRDPTICRYPCATSNPVARVHTPERLEACLVEGRFGVADLDVATAQFDLTYQRRGGGWVEEVMINGRPWLRFAVWLSPPDKVHVEATARESFAEVAAVIEALPTTVKRRSKREHGDRAEDYPYGYRQPRLHRADALHNRPTPGPAEALEDLRVEHERRWLQRPHPLLGDMTPEASAKDEQQLHVLLDVLELAQVRGRDRVGLHPGADINRIRESLGIGRRW